MIVSIWQGETRKCRLCGLEEETNEHVLWRCTHDFRMTKVRQAMTTAVQDTLTAGGAGGGVLAMAIQPWALNGVGCAMYKEEDLDELIRVVAQATPGENTGERWAKILEQQPQPGMHLSRQALYGVETMRFMEAQGIEAGRVVGMMTKVQKLVGGKQHAIWKHFNDGIHKGRLGLEGNERDTNRELRQSRRASSSGKLSKRSVVVGGGG